jgi:pyruvate/2-oxoglutarate dehydrogenase complex dihydrolipoamide acyltransferase (E2) component
VRKLAQELGVDLALVAGSGPQGRIVEEDVQAFAAKGGAGTAVAAPAKAAGPRAPVAAGDAEDAVALTGVRKTIAQRMTQSAFSAPHAWLVVECDVTGLVRLRSAAKVHSESVTEST